jgi:hypothetical protein
LKSQLPLLKTHLIGDAAALPQNARGLQEYGREKRGLENKPGRVEDDGVGFFELALPETVPMIFESDFFDPQDVKYLFRILLVYDQARQRNLVQKPDPDVLDANAGVNQAADLLFGELLKIRRGNRFLQIGHVSRAPRDHDPEEDSDQEPRPRRLNRLHESGGG